MGNIATDGLPVKARLEIAQPLLRDGETSASFKMGSLAFTGTLIVSRHEHGLLFEYAGLVHGARWGKVAFSMSSLGELTFVKDQTSAYLRDHEKLPEEIMSRVRHAYRGTHEAETAEETAAIDDTIAMAKSLVRSELQGLLTNDTEYQELSPSQLTEVQDLFRAMTLHITGGNLVIELTSPVHTVHAEDLRIEGPLVGMAFYCGIEKGSSSVMISLCSPESNDKYIAYGMAPFRNVALIDQSGTRYTASRAHEFLTFEVPANGKFTFDIS